MEAFHALMDGFAVCLQWQYLFFAVLGCLVGTLIGVLPGVGPAAGTAMLLPLTFGMSPIASIIMLSAIYYGSMYGGTITSVLVNVPGEAASAITCLDGYAMAKKGRAGSALAIAAIGSFIGGNVATMGLVLLALPLTAVALKFGPPEFFSLMLIGLSLATTLASRSVVRALISAVLGLLLAMIGMDPVLGVPRFTFGEKELLDGIGIVPIAMGLFGIGELLLTAEGSKSSVIHTRLREMWPSWQEMKASIWPIFRGTGIGFFLGLIPGIGVLVPTFISYAVEKKISKTPEKFGTGMIEGVAAPETANNAYCNAAMIPLFTLGVPGSAVIAILMSAFMMNGLIPGPLPVPGAPGHRLGRHRQLLRRQPDPAGHEPADDPDLGFFPENIDPDSVHAHPGILRDRRLQRPQQRVRRRADAGLRLRGVRLQETRHPPGPHDPDRHSGARSWRERCGNRSRCRAATSPSFSRGRSRPRSWGWRRSSWRRR